MKFMTIVGARPQFVKLGPLSRVIRQNHEEVIVHTGQHYDHSMSDTFFDQLDIPKPDVNLSIGSANHGAQTGQMLARIEEQILVYKPDVIICFGDTNSTLAACLAASKLQVPSIHIEAGLRSFNRTMPEEINRVVADHTADLLLAPTKTAVSHLEREGLGKITRLTGDIMVDSVEYVQAKMRDIPPKYQDYIILTLHRPYNVDNTDNLILIFEKLGHLPSLIIFPVHPRTRLKINESGISIPDNITIIEPQGYIEFQHLLKYCTRVITDSGGLQKEAYLAGKPCVTLRSETEWVETIEVGWNYLADIKDPMFINNILSFEPLSVRPNLYGKNVALTMLTEIENYLAQHS